MFANDSFVRYGLLNGIVVSYCIRQHSNRDDQYRYTTGLRWTARRGHRGSSYLCDRAFARCTCRIGT